MQKMLVTAKSNLVQNVLKHCDEAAIKKFNGDSLRVQRCNPTIAEIHFFQGLAKAIRTYSWPTDLKLEGKKVALDYVSFFSEGHYPLLSRLIAISVLDELSVNKIVNEDLHREIKQIVNDSQLFVEGLRGRMTKDPALTCESVAIIRDELGYSDEVAKKIKNLLSRI